MWSIKTRRASFCFTFNSVSVQEFVYVRPKITLIKLNCLWSDHPPIAAAKPDRIRIWGCKKLFQNTLPLNHRPTPKNRPNQSDFKLIYKLVSFRPGKKLLNSQIRKAYIFLLLSRFTKRLLEKIDDFFPSPISFCATSIFFLS